MATSAEIETRIAEAEAALHALATGQRVVEVWRDGKRMIFSQATIGQLRTYLADLKLELASLTAVADGKPRRRAIGLAFRN